MKQAKKIKLVKFSKILLIIFTFMLVILSKNVVVSKTLTPTKNDEAIPSRLKIPYQISQNFLTIKFGDNYYAKLGEADHFYKQGDLAKVKQIQQQVKKDFAPVPPPPTPQVDVSSLSAGGRRLWETANQGMQQGRGAESKIFESLQRLTQISPDFVPGHLLLVEAYEKYNYDGNNPEQRRRRELQDAERGNSTQEELGQKDRLAKALGAIERLSELYPELADVLDKRIDLLAKNKQYLEASIAARQFALTYPDSPEAARFNKIAQEQKQKFLENLQQETIAMGIVVGGLSLLTGDSSGSTAVQFLLAGESEAGRQMAEIYKQQYQLIENPKVSTYINNIGQKLAQLMGRDEFKYEFYVINEPSPNAFALPGGKIFIHTGILELIGSEAELAGILSHEIAHSVLSHSFQKLSAQALTQIIPFARLVNAEISREKEKEADILGTRVLNAAGYSADGLYNLMAKLKQLEQKSNLANSLLATHPTSNERMRYLEELIQNKGYNRYGYEGVQSYRDAFI